MIHVMIRLNMVEKVSGFVNIVSRYPYKMDLREGRHVVDAKSILGIFSLDLSPLPWRSGMMTATGCWKRSAGLRKSKET